MSLPIIFPKVGTDFYGVIYISYVTIQIKINYLRTKLFNTFGKVNTTRFKNKESR